MTGAKVKMEYKSRNSIARCEREAIIALLHTACRIQPIPAAPHPSGRLLLAPRRRSRGDIRLLPLVEDCLHDNFLRLDGKGRLGSDKIAVLIQFNLSHQYHASHTLPAPVK